MKSGEELHHVGSTRSLVYSKARPPEIMAILASGIIGRLLSCKTSLYNKRTSQLIGHTCTLHYDNEM
jgi:hypothetical protein